MEKDLIKGSLAAFSAKVNYKCQELICVCVGQWAQKRNMTCPLIKTVTDGTQAWVGQTWACSQLPVTVAVSRGSGGEWWSWAVTRRCRGQSLAQGSPEQQEGKASDRSCMSSEWMPNNNRQREEAVE